MEAETRASSFEVQVLGPVVVLADGTQVDLRGKPALLVALLVASAGDVVSVDALIDGLWGEDPPATARKAVQVNVSNARRALGADFPLQTTRGGYVVASDALSIDAARFLADVDAAADLIDDSAASAVDTLDDALGLWRGSPYTGFEDSEPLRGEIVRLNEQRVRAKRLLFDARLRLGDHIEVVGELDAAAAEHPYNEDLRRLHMLALYRSGRQTEALRAFDRTRELLIDAGLEPSHELRQLHQQILEQDPGLDPPANANRVSMGAPLAVGHAVRGYELRDRLSESGNGTVYRAYQAAVGREVAIKVVPPTLANAPEFVRRFEAEARFVAQLEHPHIAPLYDYWRDPAGAYLVMQWPRAGSVADALETRRFEPAAALRILGQVGAALSYAHRQGVFHRDLRPSSVLLDEEGNGYLADFGVASEPGTAIDVSKSPTAAYVAPELLAGGEFDARCEVYSLALLANEMLTGTRPSLGAQPEPVAEGPAHRRTELDAVLAAGTAPDPEMRYQRIEDFLRALRQVFGADVTTTETAAQVDVRNPYKGLRAFAEIDARDFFGRDELVSQLTSRVTTSQIIAVVGPSGSGKSSLVRAGLLPIVREHGFGTGRDVVIAEMFPGSYPFEELEAALTRVAVHRPPTLLADLLSDERGLLRASKQILAGDDTDLLLVIDQFEELFSLTADEMVRRAFLDNLVAVARDERSRVKVVLTMRADFFDRPLAYPEFGEELSAALVTVAMPGQDELAQAISAPAKGAGLELEAGLISIITRYVADEPGALPLMQYALTELAEARIGRDLTIEAYEGTGGVIGALSRRAEEIYAALPEAAQSVAEELFVHLVAVDEDSDDTRRRVRRSELDSLGLNANALSTVIADYGSFRLLSFDHDPVTRGQTVEVAHEALIREWPRYRAWIDERRESLIMQRRLQASAAEWEASDRNSGFLFTGGRLEHYEQWAETPDARLRSSERALLAHSRTFQDDRIRHEQSRRRRVLMLVCGLAAIAGVVATIAVVQQRRAESATEAAEQATLLSQSETVRANEQTLAATDSALAADLSRMRAQAVSEVVANAPLAALLAAEAYAIDGSSVSAGALQRVLTGVGGRQATLVDGPAAYSPNWASLSADMSLVAVTTDTTVDVWDLDTRTLALRREAAFPALGLRPDGALVGVNERSSEQIDLVEIASGDVVGSIAELGCQVLRFSPDGDRLAIVVDDPAAPAGCNGVTIPGTLQIWDVSDPSRPQLEHVNTDGEVFNVWWAPDGSGYLSLTGDARLDFRNTATYESNWTHEFDLTSGATLGEFARTNSGALFRSDGKSVTFEATFNENAGSLLFTFDTESGALIGSPTSTTFLRSMNWWNEDETQLVGTLGPSGVTVIDLEQSEVVLPSPIENPNATSVWVDRDNGRIVISSFIGIEVFSLDGTSVLERRVALTEEQLAIKAEFNPQVLGSITADGSRLWTGMNDPSRQVPTVEWDLTTEPPSKIGPQDEFGFAFDQGDSSLFFELAGMQVLDGNHQPLGPPIGYEVLRGEIVAWLSSSDGSVNAPFARDLQIIDLFDTETGTRTHEIDAFATDEKLFGSNMSFTSDGAFMLATISTASGESWAVFDTETGDAIHRVEAGPSSGPILAGRTIYSTPPGSFELVRRDVETLEIVGPPLIGHTIAVNEFADDLDSDRIVTQAINGNVRVWDRETGEQIGSEIAVGRQNAGNDISIAQDGNLIGISLDKQFALWNYDTETWPALACQIAGRNMTHREWDDFGPQGAEYRVTCPQFPAGN